MSRQLTRKEEKVLRSLKLASGVESVVRSVWEDKPKPEKLPWLVNMMLHCLTPLMILILGANIFLGEGSIFAGLNNLVFIGVWLVNIIIFTFALIIRGLLPND